MAKAIRSGEILNFARFQVSETAGGAFTQIEIDTNLSAERSLIWFIKSIQLDFAPAATEQPVAQSIESINVQITRESKTSLLDYNDADIIEKFAHRWVRGPAIGAEIGPMYYIENSPLTITYPHPIPYGSRSVYIGIQSTYSFARVARGRIGYTTEKVSERDFYRIAQSLLG